MLVRVVVLLLWAALVAGGSRPAFAAPSEGGASSTASGSSSSSAPPSFEARMHERAVFSVRSARAGQSAQERARAAGAALDRVVDDPEEPDARVEEAVGTAVVFVGKTPIVTLGEEDAEAAGGEVTLHVYAASVASRIDDALRTERRRSAIAEHVFSLSLLVFSALLAFLLFRRVGELVGSARMWVRAHPDQIPALRIGRIDVVRPAAVRGAVSVALALAHRLAQFAIVYFWLIFALSRFEATRAYTDRLAGFMLTPLSALVGRLGASLPLVVVAAVAAVALGIAVRFVALFFAGVERGETHVPWLPRELAGPTSVLVRAGMVLASIVLAAPLITGTDDGALSRAGVVALAALGIACTPVLACAAAGVPAVFGRRLRPGDYVEAGGRAGVVRDVTLLEIVLEDPFGCEVRVPQLLGLWHATRVLGSGPLASIDVVVDPREPSGRVEEALVGAVVATCERARVELLSLDADGARWRVSGVPKHAKGAASMADAVTRAIARQGIALGRSRRAEGTS
jgi:small-conductance mechanosensitive channel